MWSKPLGLTVRHPASEREHADEQNTLAQSRGVAQQPHCTKIARVQLEGMLPTLSAAARNVYSWRHTISPHSEARRSQPGTAVTPPLRAEIRDMPLARGARERRRCGPVRCRPGFHARSRSLRFEAGKACASKQARTKPASKVVALAAGKAEHVEDAERDDRNDHHTSQQQERASLERDDLRTHEQRS